MLRITADEKPRILTLRLEGRLEGPWAEELEKCWRGMLAGANRPTLRVDLSGVTFVDAAGKARLAAMHRRGAEFITDDCLMEAVVAEIAGAPGPRRLSGRSGAPGTQGVGTQGVGTTGGGEAPSIGKQGSDSSTG